MKELIRDSTFGHIVRLVSRNKLFSYPEERDPSLWKKWYSEEKSAFVAHHGDTDAPETEYKDENGERQKKKQTLDDLRPDRDDQSRNNSRSNASSQTRNGDQSDHELRSREETDVELSDRDHRAGAETDAEPEKRLPGSWDPQMPLAQPHDHRKTINRSGVPVDPEKGRDATIIDWDGPNDPENPVNWSMGKKFFVTFEICLLTFGVYIGSAIYSAGEMGIEKQFHVGQVAATLGLTLFVCGYGLGPMLWAPMSEIPQIGRNPIYIGTLIVFVFLQFAVIYAKNFGMLLAFRFLTGFFGSPVLATGGASLGDIYVPRKRAYAICIWGIAAVCGPVMGPLVGGFAAQAKGWTWTIWELIWLSGFALIFLIFFLPETSANNILYRKTNRLRKLTGNKKLLCEPEIEGQKMTVKDLVMMTLVRPFQLSFFEPMVLFPNLYIALIYGLLYIWFESFPIVFVKIYGFSLGKEGLAFLGILIGTMIAIPPFFWYLHRYQEPQFNEQGEIQPEKRLPPAMFGGVCIVICLFWFGWTAGRTHWIVPIIGSAWFGVGSVLLFNSVLNYLGDAYPQYAASVLAGNDLMRSSFGAGFPLFATAMYNKLGVAWATSLLGFLSIAFLPIPFVLYKFGPGLRKNHSKFARKDL